MLVHRSKFHYHCPQGWNLSLKHPDLNVYIKILDCNGWLLLSFILGLRVDGRRPHELRKVQCQVGIFKQADGSSFLEQGNTKVLASVYGPHDVCNKLYST